MKTYMQGVLDGEIEINSIDNYIEKWHNSAISDQNVSLHSYLGMTWEEYRFFLESNNALDLIIHLRKEGKIVTRDSLLVLMEERGLCAHFIARTNNGEGMCMKCGHYFSKKVD